MEEEKPKKTNLLQFIIMFLIVILIIVLIGMSVIMKYNEINTNTIQEKNVNGNYITELKN